MVSWLKSVFSPTRFLSEEPPEPQFSTKAEQAKLGSKVLPGDTSANEPCFGSISWDPCTACHPSDPWPPRLSHLMFPQKLSSAGSSCRNKWTLTPVIVAEPGGLSKTSQFQCSASTGHSRLQFLSLSIATAWATCSSGKLLFNALDSCMAFESGPPGVFFPVHSSSLSSSAEMSSGLDTHSPRDSRLL